MSTADQLDHRLSEVDRFILRMRRLYTVPTDCAYLDPKTAESVAVSLHIAHLDADALAPEAPHLHAVRLAILHRATTADTIAACYRHRAAHLNCATMARIDTDYADRMARVATELRKTARALETEFAEQW